MYSHPSYMKRYKATNELLTPPPGTCWSPVRLLDHNCEGCKYFDACTHKKKGKRKKN